MASHVELSDFRTITGRGETLNKLKFPKFHIFDANWTLKLGAEWDETARGHRISVKLSHSRRDTEDPWELTGKIGFEIGAGEDSEEKEPENLVDCRFSHAQYRLEIGNWGISKEGGFEQKSEGVEVKVRVFIKILHSSGIQPRYFLDFSQPLPIFSDATILVGGQKFHVNRMMISMASPVLFHEFLRLEMIGNAGKPVKIDEICGDILRDPGDFRRILNLIYPPHLVPKKWIKEPSRKKQLADIYRFLDIAKSLECGIAMETVDEWIAKYGRFDLGTSVVLAQNFGLRRLMGTKIASIQSISDLHECSDEFQMFSQKTKALIFDHVLTLL